MTQSLPGRQIEVLLVEDDPGDVLMTKEAFEDYKLSNSLHVVNDGAEAMEFLRRQGEHTDAPRPDLVLLDLNLPRIDGRDALRAIKGDPELRYIPVVVFTTSNAVEDVALCYGLGANGFVRKPMDMPALVDLVSTVGHYWLDLVEPLR